MKITVTIDLSDDVMSHITQHSIERVINTSMRTNGFIVDGVGSLPKIKFDAETNMEDWDVLKWIVVRIWQEFANKIRQERHKVGARK